MTKMTNFMPKSKKMQKRCAIEESKLINVQEKIKGYGEI